MRIPDAALQELLIKNQKASQDVLDELVAESKAQKTPLQDLVLRKQIVSEKELTKIYAASIDVPYVELANLKVDKEVANLVSDRIAQKYRSIVFEKTPEGKVKVAMDDPDDVQAIDFLQKQLGQELEVYIAPKSEIEVALNEYYGSISNEISKVATTDEEESDEEEVDEEELSEDSPIAQTVNLIIEYAIKQKASDIHIEPHEDHVQVRYRIDGVLKEANKLPRKVLGALVSRIKILSNLKIDEHRAPQDGRFKITLSGELYAIRVSTLPVMDGEKVVMRLLNESTTALTLEDLGFWGSALQRVNSAISQPHGIILVTGPTGSGKSTTLYSILSQLNKPDVNISTIEDPVEYRIEGANQTQVNVKAKMTFAAGLRALLRQDPNIIMVGEIRDSETANLAIQAALTGHLVFSTLHTNNAATCLPRLLDMGVEPFLIASTVRAVIGQRLVRKLKGSCREPYQPEGEELKEIQKTFKIDEGVRASQDANDLKKLVQDDGKASPLKTGVKNKVIQPLNADKVTKSLSEELAEDPGLVERTAKEAEIKKKVEEISTEKKSTPKESSKPSAKSPTLWRAKNEGDCAGQAYKGRIGIYEVIEITPSIQKLITSNATSEDIQNQAIEEEMITMQQDGFVKTIQGLTTIEEILRVTRE